MADLTQMIRWNANFVRGLAESVLSRAKTIRSSLTPSVDSAPTKSAAGTAKTPKAKSAALKKAAVKRATSKPRTKRTDA